MVKTGCGCIFKKIIIIKKVFKSTYAILRYVMHPSTLLANYYLLRYFCLFLNLKTENYKMSKKFTQRVSNGDFRTHHWILRITLSDTIQNKKSAIHAGLYKMVEKSSFTRKLL